MMSHIFASLIFSKRQDHVKRTSYHIRIEVLFNHINYSWLLKTELSPLLDSGGSSLKFNQLFFVLMQKNENLPDYGNLPYYIEFNSWYLPEKLYFAFLIPELISWKYKPPLPVYFILIALYFWSFPDKSSASLTIIILCNTLSWQLIISLICRKEEYPNCNLIFYTFLKEWALFNINMRVTL